MTQALIAALVIFDIDGVIRDVGNSYRRALADTVEQFTNGEFRPSMADIDHLKAEGVWNNDWEASREFIYRHFEQQGKARTNFDLEYDQVVAFFQSRYRGTEAEPEQWSGYIGQEPLLLKPAYLEQLSQAGMPWGFFSGATRGSASYVLGKRLGLNNPVLVAMEDAPGKPDPTGLFASIQQLEERWKPASSVPVVYVGDTVADMHTIRNAQELYPLRHWIAVGILPPHAQTSADYAAAYTQTLIDAGAIAVFENVEQLTPPHIQTWITAA